MGEIHCPYHGPFSTNEPPIIFGRSGVRVSAQSRGRVSVEPGAEALRRLGLSKQKRFPIAGTFNELPFDFFVETVASFRIPRPSNTFGRLTWEGGVDPAPVSKRDQIKERLLPREGIPMLI